MTPAPAAEGARAVIALCSGAGVAGHPHTRTIELPTIFPVSLVCSSASSARKYRPHARQIATNITIRYPATYTVAVYMKAMLTASALTWRPSLRGGIHCPVSQEKEGSPGVGVYSADTMLVCAACSIISVLTQWGATLVIQLRERERDSAPASRRNNSHHVHGCSSKIRMMHMMRNWFSIRMSRSCFVFLSSSSTKVLLLKQGWGSKAAH